MGIHSIQQNRSVQGGVRKVPLESVKVKDINSEKRNGSKDLNSWCPGISLYDGWAQGSLNREMWGFGFCNIQEYIVVKAKLCLSHSSLPGKALRFAIKTKEARALQEHHLNLGDVKKWAEVLHKEKKKKENGTTIAVFCLLCLCMCSLSTLINV